MNKHDVKNVIHYVAILLNRYVEIRDVNIAFEELMALSKRLDNEEENQKGDC